MLSMFLESFLKSNTNKLPPIAQLVEQLPFKQTVVGSSPTGRTSKNRESGFFVRPVGLEPKAPVNKEVERLCLQCVSSNFVARGESERKQLSIFESVGRKNI